MDSQQFSEQLSHKEKKSYYGLDDETRGWVTKFPEKKRRAVLSLSEENAREWERLYKRLHNCRKRCRDMEDLLDQHLFQPHEKAEGFKTLLGLNKDRDDCAAAEEHFLASCMPSNGGETKMHYDRYARPGVISIRPTLKSNYTASASRQPIPANQ